MLNTTSIRTWVGSVVMGLILSGTILHAAPVTPADPVESRVDSLLGQMTLDEKMSLLAGDHFSTVAIPRLGIPKVLMSDGPQGVRNYGSACSFPVGVALAATWDATLSERYGRALALEARARGVHIMLGPGVNISRLPINGRNFEYFGEDPFLVSEVASHWIDGMQNEGVVATVKHYAANNQETDRTNIDVRVDDRAFHEIYLPAFRRAVEESHVGAVMAAYNRFRGDYCASSSFLEHTILRDELGFKGLVMSDWGACHASSDLAAGLDLEMPTGERFLPQTLKDAIAKGAVQPRDVDDAVRHMLRVFVSMGFLDHAQKRTDIPLDSPDSAKTALDVARAGIVLLKNDKSLLPLDRTKTHRIAVYGPNAIDTPRVGGGSGSVRPYRSVDFFTGVKALGGSNVEVVVVPDRQPAADEVDHCPLVRTAPDGPVGFKLTAREGSSGRVVELPVQSGVNLKWKAGELPFGIKGESAEYIYSGVLVADEDGAWEVFCDNWVQCKVDGVLRGLAGGEMIHVKKGVPVPIEISERNIKMEPAKDRAYRRWLVIRKLQLPDLAEAKKADAVIVCAGFRSTLEGEETDRTFDLQESQQALIRALAEVNPKVIVTLTSGAAVGMTDWLDKVPAVLETWYLGQEGGTAFGEVVFGDTNPSGRLPSTFDRSLADNAAAGTYPGKPEAGQPWAVVHYSEGIFVGYRGYDKYGKDPLFPFGYGLSYTTFDYSGMEVKKAANGVARVILNVKNTGTRPGSEVVQIYVGQPKCSVERPVRELKGFTKVALQPGETKRVEIALPADSFAFWHPGKRAWTVEPGEFVIEAGHSSREIWLKRTLALKGTDTVALRTDQAK